MSENGPYNQPPQNPYGGGDGTGGQPPYGAPSGGQPPYGHTGGQPPYGPGAGAQPPYGQGPYPGNPGQDQGMYAGGQPPYGGHGGPGGPGGYPPPQQPPQGGGGKAGLWVVIGGGAIIVVLVIAVIIMLVARGGGDDQVAAGPDETTQTTEETEEPADDGSEEPATGGDGPTGEPPYALPTEPCDAMTDELVADFGMRDNLNKNVSDSRSSCTASGDAPEGNPDRAYSSLWLEYRVPFGGSDSIESATTDFQNSIDNYTGGVDYYPEESLEEDKALDGLGDEAHLIVTESTILDDPAPTAVLLVRAGNMNIEYTYQVSSFDGSELVMIDDVEALLTDAAAESLTLLGAE
ncbi:DUF3558 domain-containing protein [Nocardiopsis sp. MG754419]|uniref:DUF3558 domain-containing protein n=1 Tax=Nocardiopsis sp. MG754419 TaxID=2259865 RepID=UPI001BA4805F|nr:DUF3558 domain-containing protein [Nocardiopsis sp. MG754419]MBR8742520.1 DUF3558 domain-containing protein [Nocardiopsis sp. MG754419]